MTLMVRESFVNLTKGWRIGDSDWYETWTDDKGKLYRDCQREYGRCVSSMYRDPDARKVGWVFQKREKYSDSKESYLKETWVEVREEKENANR